MMHVVRKLANNPMANTSAAHTDEDDDLQAKGFETALLENTLTKIAALMQVGFGAAGGDVIGQNLASGNDTIDPMVPGKKITSIYGFCDIRKFTDTTECLQEEVMVYVNKLGAIMHGVTHGFYGCANKNIGDAFLLTWKICDGELLGFSLFADVPTEDTRLRANQSILCPPHKGAGRKFRTITPTEMADSALHAFIKGQVDLYNANRGGCLTEYLTYPRILKRFGEGFTIRMGFGMHVGWCIEGAIGSKYKIDATYLSPHAELADRLEAGSKIFGTPINMSHWMCALLSPAARDYMRKIDRIKATGVSAPITIYTFDVINHKVGFGAARFTATGEQIPVNFQTDPEYAELIKGMHPQFHDTFAQGLQFYLDGNWGEAKAKLEVALTQKPEDGPALNLMNVMSEYDFNSPKSWPGYREMDNF
jgi:class 3 adenylate cyclase